MGLVVNREVSCGLGLRFVGAALFTNFVKRALFLDE
jgi:hypothetical protein